MQKENIKNKIIIIIIQPLDKKVSHLFKTKLSSAQSNPFMERNVSVLCYPMQISTRFRMQILASSKCYALVGANSTRCILPVRKLKYMTIFLDLDLSAFLFC